MEMVCKRFPCVNQKILKNLDNQSLTRSKEASRVISKFVKNERFYWIRVIKKYSRKFQEFEESWKEVITKIPSVIAEELAFALRCFFETSHLENIAPLHFAAHEGSFQLCQYIIRKTKNKNP